MPLTCEAKATLLQPPEGGLKFIDQLAITTSPFTLSGAPMSNRPESIQGLSELRRKPTAYTNFALPDLYFDRQNYYEIFLDTSNILEGNAGTTLRYEGVSFSLVFAALHRGLWDAKQPQFSMFFTNSSSHFFHICIPVVYTNTEKEENLFLASWLSNRTPPPGLTINDIFSSKGSDSLEFSILPYCLEYNKGRNHATYTLALFNTPCKLATTKLPAWLQEDRTLEKEVPIPGENDTSQRYRRTTFDQIFNYMMRGTIRKWVADKPDPFAVTEDKYFDGSKQQSIIRPTFVKVPQTTFSTRRFETSVDGFQNPNEREIKCYPLDLTTDVRDRKIILDETKKVAVPYEEYKQTSLLAQVFDPSAVSFLNTARYYVILFVVLLVSTILIIAAVFFVFRSRSTVDTSTVTSPTTSMTEQITAILTDASKNTATKTTDLAKLIATSQ